MAEAEGGSGTEAEGIPGLDTSVAHPARVYDYWLGGRDNFAADREAAERVLAVAPGLRYRVRANRAFLGRATRYLAAEAGIRQFLDIGTGIPAAGNTHEVASQGWCRCTSGAPSPATSPGKGPYPHTAPWGARPAPSRPEPGLALVNLAVTWSAPARLVR